MNKIAILLLAFAPAFTSCDAADIATTDADSALIVSLQDQISVVEAARLAAVEAGDEAAADAAEAAIQSLQTSLDVANQDAAQDRIGGIVGAIRDIPIVGDWAAAFSPLLVMGLPLIRKRGRRNGANLLRDLSPTSERSLKEFPGDFLKYIGASHSPPESEAAAESTA